MKLSASKTNHIVILLFLSAVILSLSGCATAPIFSNTSIPQGMGGGKLKIAIQKEDIQFSGGVSPLSGDQVAIYNCIGMEIYKNIPNASVTLVDKNPVNSNIIYIHNFRKAISWDVNPFGEFVSGLLVIPGLFETRTTNATFKADALINGKNYAIKAYGSHTQSDLTAHTHKILRKICGDFTEKLNELIMQTFLERQIYNPINKNAYYQSESSNKISYYHSKVPNNSTADYAKTDPTFNMVAIQVYKTNSPYIYSQGTYTYNAIPITTTLSGCKIVSVIRRINGAIQRNIENYKICNSKISEIKNSNMANWDALPEEIKPIVNKVINETREYRKASANYYRYAVIGRGYNGKTVSVYVLKGIRLEAMINSK